MRWRRLGEGRAVRIVRSTSRSPGGLAGAAATVANVARPAGFFWPLTRTDGVEGTMADSPSSWPEEPPPRHIEIFERALLLLFLATVILGVSAVGVGCLSGSGRMIGVGAALCAVAWATRAWLVQRGRFESLLAALDGLGGAGATIREDATAFARLAELLQQLDRLERARETPAFEPWAVQEIRHEIRALIEAEPELARLFQRARRAA